MTAVLGPRELNRALLERQHLLRRADRGVGETVEHLLGLQAQAPLPPYLPPRGVWGAGGQARYATLERWTGRELDAEPAIDDVVLRYLGAFGPASVMDMQSWSGLTRLAAAFERLRPRLEVFAGENGRELFDLPDGPRPGPDVPAPVRFLGEYDNVLLGHADRSRIVPAGFVPVPYVGHVLVDGMLSATWKLEDGALVIRPLGEVPRDEVEAEARAVLAFLGEERRVRFERRW